MVGFGHVYQGRFKSFPVETDEYFYQVIRYTERNALRANLVERAEDWPYGSLWIHQQGSAEHRAMLSAWPLPRPRKWLQYVNEPETEAELSALRRSCLRGTPYGSLEWVEKTVNKLGLEATMRTPGRPKKR
jgi:putative transposase